MSNSNVEDRFITPVPIWWFFTTLYGVILGMNFPTFVKILPYEFMGSAQSLILLAIFVLSFSVVVVDWIWTSVLLADYPGGYGYYNRFVAGISGGWKLLILFIHTAFIVTYGISFSLVAYWPWWSKDTIARVNNPILWYFISLVIMNLWDISAYVSGLIKPRPLRSFYWIPYWLAMWGVLLLLLSWLLVWSPCLSEFLTQHQRLAFCGTLIILLFFRGIGLRKVYSSYKEELP